MTVASYLRASHLAWRRIGDEVVIVNLAAKEMLGLDATAGALFERLATPHSPEQLAALFAGDAPGRLPAIASFCGELARAGVLVTGEERSAAQPDSQRLPWSEPKVLWREPLTAVVNQASPAPQLGNPQCGY